MEEKTQMLLKLEALKKELADKSKKLEKSKHGAKVRAYVRRKVKEHNDLESLGVGSYEKSSKANNEKKSNDVDRRSKQMKVVDVKVSGGDVLCQNNLSYLDRINKQVRCIGEMSAEEKPVALLDRDKIISKSKSQQINFCENIKNGDEKSRVENKNVSKIIDIDCQIVTRPKSKVRKKLIAEAEAINTIESNCETPLSHVVCSSNDEVSDLQRKISVNQVSNSVYSLEDNEVIKGYLIQSANQALTGNKNGKIRSTDSHVPSSSKGCDLKSKQLMKSNIIPTDFKSVGCNSVLCEESAHSMTPSFQSGKQHNKGLVDLDRTSTISYISKKNDGLMSNIDFLNILGIPKKDYDTDKFECGSHNIHSDHIGYRRNYEKIDHKDENFATGKENNNSKTPKHDLRGGNSTCNPQTISDKPATQRSNSDVTNNIISNVKPICHTPSSSVINSLAIIDSGPTSLSPSLSAEYTELDVIPYSQFELTEDFLSETPNSQTNPTTNSRKRKGGGRQAGPLIKRKSPRLSSNLFPQKNSLSPSLDSQSSTDSLSWYNKSKQYLPAQKKAVAVMSVFQLLIDKAKMSNLDFQLPVEFLGLLESKTKGIAISGNKPLQRKVCTKLSHQDICIIEDSEGIDDMNEEKSENEEKYELQDITVDFEGYTSCKKLDIIAETEMDELDGETEKTNFTAGDSGLKIINDFLIEDGDEKLLELKERKSCLQGTDFEIEERENDNGRCNDHKSVPYNGTWGEQNENVKGERVLEACGGDADNEFRNGIVKELDDNSVIQSSYHSTPVKRPGSEKRNKITLLQCRKSLSKSMKQGGNSLARLALNNNSKNEVHAYQDVKKITDPTECDINLKCSSEMSEAFCDINQRMASPFKCDKSPNFVSSSTPKSDRCAGKILSEQERLSPIIIKLFSPLQTKVTTKLSRSISMSPESGNVSLYEMQSVTSTPNPKQVQQNFPFSPIEKSVHPEDINTSGFYDGNDSVHFVSNGNTPTTGFGESNKDNISDRSGLNMVLKHSPNINANSISDANSSSKTETRFGGGDNEISITLSVSNMKENKVSSLSKTLESIYPDDKSESNNSNRFDVSDWKSPFSKYLEESVVLQMTNNDDDSKMLNSPVRISPWQRVPKTASTPLQIFETSCTASPRLLSPVFTPSRTSRSRSKPSSHSATDRSKRTLKFEGCFQSCSEDAVVQLLHGKLFVNETVADCDYNDGDKWKRYLVSIQASALTVWIQNENNHNNWSPELDWRLSANIHILHACILPVNNKIAIAASGWDKRHPIVTVFVYDFVKDDTLRFNIPDLLQSNLSISEIHLCPSLSTSFMTTQTPSSPPSLLLGISSDDQHTLHQIRFHSDIQNVAASEPFHSLYVGKLNTLLICRGQEKACASLTWDQRITLWNTEHRIAIITVSIPSDLPCLTAIVDVRAVKGLLFVTASWRVEDIGDCGGILVWNPMTGCLFKTTRVWNIPNVGWRSTEKTNKDRNQIYSVSSTGSVSWWDSQTGDMVGHRQSNIATCVSGIDNRNLVVGEMHGCVHLYSML